MRLCSLRHLRAALLVVGLGSCTGTGPGGSTTEGGTTGTGTTTGSCDGISELGPERGDCGFCFPEGAHCGGLFPCCNGACGSDNVCHDPSPPPTGLTYMPPEPDLGIASGSTGTGTSTGTSG